MATSSNAQAVDEPDQEPCCLTAVHLGGGVKDLIEVMSARVGGDVHDVGSSAGELARGCIAMARAQVATAMALKQSTSGYVLMNSPFSNAAVWDATVYQDDQGLRRTNRRSRCQGDRRLSEKELRQLKFTASCQTENWDQRKLEVPDLS